MKRYFVKDTDEGFEVTETDEEIITEPETIEEMHDEMQLSEEEIQALKNLASVAEKLIALVNVNSTDECEHNDEDPENPDETIDSEEEVVDTDEEEELGKMHDSKKSIGSIQKNTTTDSVEVEDDICDAWAKRYGG